uniref:Transferase, transferring glycosyl groups n=1 Tax=Cucumis sativus TaxID=3659 RepID=A0A0A0KAA8_CUCSA
MTTSKGKFYLILSLLSVSVNYSISEDPVPTPWPPQFHSIYVTNFSGVLEITDLWYDWPNGRNFNIVQHQLGTLLYGIEWNNGTEFLYTLDSSKTCDTIQFEVGLLPPKWLDGAHYLGQRHVDGFLCNVWEKVDFIWYYEDVETKIPVYWLFYDVGAVLEDEKWQAPVYCFDSTGTAVNDVALHQNLPLMADVNNRLLHQNFPAI